MSDVLPALRPIGKLEQLCRDRNARDLQLAYGGRKPRDPRDTHHPRGLWFDAGAGDFAVRWIEKYCRHHKGEWAGRQLVLEEWQRRNVQQIFGWRRADGTRRFRRAWWETPRKAGKTQIAGAIGLHLLVGDNEPGAEVYTTAPLALDTPIPTPSGWTAMGELRVGDLVFDELGRVTRVIGTSAVMRDRECFAVRFHDGEEIIADAEHLWDVQSTLAGSLAGKPKTTWSRRAMKRGSAICTTAEIRSTLRTPQGNANHAVRVAGPLDTAPADLPIPPYTLGVWLGDGRSNRGSIVCHPSDEQIRREIEGEGFVTRQHGLNDQDGLLHYTVLGLRTLLRVAGLLNAKHVPAVYLRAAPAQRTALLQGLMDTDGTCTKTGECRFSNRDLALAEAVAELARSLGILPHIHAVSVSGRPHWLVSFRVPPGMPVFRLERKRRRQIAPSIRARRRFIVAVDPVPSVPVRCIAVDSESHLFLAGRGMIPTHNTKKEQAWICHEAARQMVRRSPELREIVRVPKNKMATLTCESLGSFMAILASDHGSLDGPMPHGDIRDEVHAWTAHELAVVLDTASGSRRQPLTLEITTAGVYDPEGVGPQHHEYAVDVLEGRLEDEALFAFIAAADEGDDPWNPATWWKANPNLGISVKLDYMQDQARRAKASASALNGFLTKLLDRWTNQQTAWLDSERWREAEDRELSEEALVGLECVGGLDLSTRRDLTALVLVFQVPEGLVLVCRFWLPRSTIEEEAKKGRRFYGEWADRGWLTACEGDTIDYAMVRQEINALGKRFRIREIGYDPANANMLAGELSDDGFTMIERRQGPLTLSEPSKLLEAEIFSRRVRATGAPGGPNPIMRWMVGNAVARKNVNGDIRPDKEKARGKIDGISATATALVSLVGGRGDSPYSSGDASFAFA